MFKVQSFEECQQQIFIKRSNTSKVIQGYTYKTTFMHICLWSDYDENLYECLVSLFFFNSRPSDLITTYSLMDNFCPCFLSVLN